MRDAGEGHWASNPCRFQGRIHLVCSDVTGANVLSNGGWVVSTINDAAYCPSDHPSLAKAAWEYRVKAGDPDTYCWAFKYGTFFNPPQCT